MQPMATRSERRRRRTHGGVRASASRAGRRDGVMPRWPTPVRP